MDLEMLKQKWSEMDDRLANVEMLNKQALQEVLKLKVNNTLHQLRLRALITFLANLFVALVMIPTLHTFNMLSPYTIWMLIIFICVGLMWRSYRSLLIGKMNITMPTSELLAITLKEQRAAIIDKFVSLPAILLCYILGFYFERTWIIERGRILPAVLLLIALILVVTIGYLRNYRKYSAFLNDVTNQLSELKEA